MPLPVAGLRSVLWVLVGIAGLALAAVGVWWTPACTGTLRVLGLLLSVTVTLTVLSLYSASGMLGPACPSLALWVPAVASARVALALPRVAPEPVEAPHDPWRS